MIAMANAIPRHHLALPYPLRICIVVPYDLADSGGVKHHAVHLAKALREEGHQVTLVGPSSRESDDPNRLVIRNIVNIRSNGAANPMALLGARSILKRFFADNTFDIIHVHEPPIPSLSYWSAWLTPGVPKVATFHAYSETPSLGIQLLERLAAPILYPYFDHAVAVSPPAARYASRTWHRPLPIVPNGIPVPMFAPSIQEAPRQGSRRDDRGVQTSTSRGSVVYARPHRRRLRTPWAADHRGTSVLPTSAAERIDRALSRV
jgi:phosphatidylinositol alpha-mannosyltransferase